MSPGTGPKRSPHGIPPGDPTLHDLAAGDRAVVTAFLGGCGFQDRILSMGLNVGNAVRVIHGARGRGPVLIAVGDTRLAIGHGMSEKIAVARIETE